MEIRYKGNARIFLIAFFGFLLICSSYLIYSFEPLKLIRNKMIYLQSESSIVYKIWQNPPYDIYLRIYIFNVTNAEKFLAGNEKLRFEEIGPYTFKEILTNTESSFDNENATLTFMPRRRIEFMRDLSVGDPEDGNILVPNLPLLGITSMLHQSSMFLNLAVLSLTRMLNTQPFLNMTVNEYFWGYDDKLVLMASRILPNWIPFERFGIMDRMFDEGNNTVTINLNPKRTDGDPLIDKVERGRLYSILSWNGSPGLEQWGYKDPLFNDDVNETNSKCNILEGAYDGTIFPPNIPKGAEFRLYRKFVCRTIPISYNHSGKNEDNFNAYFYNLADNFLDKLEDNPDNECYCKNRDYCLPAGFGDTTPCYYGFPIAVSRPHFLKAEPIYLDKIDGLLPNEEKHSTNIVINPDAGVLLKGYSRMQINLMMRQTKYNTKTAPFNNMVLPLFWSEIRCDNIPTSIYLLLTMAFKVLPVLEIVLMYLCAIVGTILIATAGILVFLTVSLPQRSPSISLGYTALKMIPVIRRESLISDFRQFHNEDN